jgi:hypothetical protein
VPWQRRTVVLGLTTLAALGGGGVALYYHRIGLTLSHYDARGHLVVARRIFDSITPGWQQIGAVWLPLPHLLNALPIQVDAWYRTGASATAISVVCFALATGCIGWIVASVTDSVLAAAAGAAVFCLNPNVLYLQATPMTELLLIGLLLLAVALLVEWTRMPPSRPPIHRGGRLVAWTFALACLTRYEAWPVTIAAFSLAAWVRWRHGATPIRAIAGVTSLAVYPAAAIVAFLVFSRVVVGAWLVDDFFVAENAALGHPYQAFAQIAWGTRMLSGYGLSIVALVGGGTLAWVGLTQCRRSVALLPLALTATSAVPYLAFLDGHPYRIRYMVPLIASQAICAGTLAGLMPKRVRHAASLALFALVLFELRPLDPQAPMVVEAQWDRPNATVRRAVSDCLSQGYDHTSVMVSMGSLGHYIQDLSREGFRIRDFLHEGNGDIWLNALSDPRPYVGWVLIEEKAEGGDMLAHRARENPRFLEGFSRVCEGAGLALYRRRQPASEKPG